MTIGLPAFPCHSSIHGLYPDLHYTWGFFSSLCFPGQKCRRSLPPLIQLFRAWVSKAKSCLLHALAFSLSHWDLVFHTIIGHLELEGSHKDHRVRLLNLKVKPQIRALSKHVLDSTRLGAVTTSLGSWTTLG